MNAIGKRTLWAIRRRVTWRGWLLAMLMVGACQRLAAQPASLTNYAARDGGRPASEAFRQQLKDLPPEVRQQRVRAYLEQKRREADQRRQATEQKREQWQQLQKNLEGLSVQERQARLQELRRQRAAAAQKGRDLSQAERLHKRQQMRERLERLMEELRRKQAKGILTAEEARRLRRMEELARRFDRLQARLRDEADRTTRPETQSGDKAHADAGPAAVPGAPPPGP